MSIHKLASISLGALLAVTLSQAAIAADDKDAGSDKPAAAASMPVYKPPMRGAPASRVGGGTRGMGDRPHLVILAPDHTGMTVHAQPTLYWYLSKPATTHLEVTVINDNSIDPVLEKTLPSSRSAGIQSLDLAKHGVKLQPGVEYRWFVALVPDNNQRSNDIIASGTIQRTSESSSLKSRLAGASSASARANAYAEEGIWYDAIATLSSEIDKNGDNSLKQQRAALLEQIGLNEVAEYDRR
jgi:hypothetical protein